MIEYLFKLLEGKFENQYQAFSHPSKYAYIRVTHINIGNGLLYGEQAYNYDLNTPYRQFILEPIQENDFVRIINYKLKTPEEFINFKNLYTIGRKDLELKSGCDIILKQNGDIFQGGLSGCNCMVDWMGRKTYLQNEIELTPTNYYVIDKGFCAENHHQLWGSKYGRFEFVRMPQ